MKIIINWLISATAILVAAYLIPQVTVESFWVAVVLAVVLGLINAVLRPILFILTLPITIVTLGLFTLIINATLIMLADYFTPGFQVASFWWAMIFSMLLSVINAVLKGMTRSDDDR